MLLWNVLSRLQSHPLLQWSLNTKMNFFVQDLRNLCDLRSWLLVAKDQRKSFEAHIWMYRGMPEQGLVSSKVLQHYRRIAKRARAVASCLACKESKVKCSDFQPCKRCHRKELHCTKATTSVRILSLPLIFAESHLENILHICTMGERVHRTLSQIIVRAPFS
jgi:phosphopantetheinyl transferase (holo-ACP synthase)